MLGDSQSICDTTICKTGPVSGHRWPDLLAAELKAKYGSHGTGMVPLIFGVGLPINSEAWTVNGGWTLETSLGPRQEGNLPGSGLVRLADGAVATFSPQEVVDHVNTYCATDAATGLLTVAIDGVSMGGVCTQRTDVPAAHMTTSAGLAPGIHTVTYRCEGQCLLYAAEGTIGKTGVSVHNLSVGGAAAEWFGADTGREMSFADLIPGGAQMVITDLLTNDPGVGYSTVSYAEAMRSVVEHERGRGARVLVVVPPVSRCGYWSDDEIHPNTAGSASEYDLIRTAVTLP